MTDFDWADDIQDHEYPEPDNVDEDFTDTILCPNCGTSVYSEAIACPSCGFYLTHQSVQRATRPVWLPWIVALLVTAFILYVIG